MRLWIKIHCSWPPSYDPYPQNNHRIHEPTGSGLAQELSISIAAIAFSDSNDPKVFAIVWQLHHCLRYLGVASEISIIYPLVNITMERSTMLLMGKSTISMVMFNSYVKLSEAIALKKRSVPFCPNEGAAKEFGGSLTRFGPWLWHWSWIFCRCWESHEAKNYPWVSKWAIRFCMVLSYTPDCRSLAIDKRSSSKPRRRNALLSLDSVIHLVNSTGVLIQHVSTLQATPCEAWPQGVELSSAEGFVINPLDARMDLAKDQEPHETPWSTS